MKFLSNRKQRNSICFCFISLLFCVEVNGCVWVLESFYSFCILSKQYLIWGNNIWHLQQHRCECFFGSLPSSKLQFLLSSRKTKQNKNLSCQPYNQLTHFLYHDILTSTMTRIGVICSVHRENYYFLLTSQLNSFNWNTIYILYMLHYIYVTSIHVKCIRSIAFYAFCNLDMENHWWQFKTC